MFRAFLIFLVVTLPLLLVGCVSMGLPKVAERPHGIEASPPVLEATGILVDSAADWESQRDRLRSRFLDEVYGDWPVGASSHQLSEPVVIDAAAYGGRGIVEQTAIEMGGAQSYLLTVRPAGQSGPVPVIIMQMFCGNRAAMGGMEGVAGPVTPFAPNCEGEGIFATLMLMIFGEHIAEPPVATILERGYALAFVYPGDIVPDSRSAAPDALARLDPNGDVGAIGAWAWVYSETAGLLEADDRFDNDRMAVWGHSRNGKSALLAAAMDERIDLVIAHQAGTGGTALTRSGKGESVAQITQGYPHWFNDHYASYAGRDAEIGIDQHQLIALMAPRPLLIGGAWRDQWADPQGSFQAGLGANPVYALYGSDGLSQAGLRDYDPEADIAVFMRNGLHGVHPSDWNAFLAFLDAHFGAGSPG